MRFKEWVRQVEGKPPPPPSPDPTLKVYSGYYDDWLAWGGVVRFVEGPRQDLYPAGEERVVDSDGQDSEGLIGIEARYVILDRYSDPYDDDEVFDLDDLFDGDDF